jgi:hypothetical protein
LSQNICILPFTSQDAWSVFNERQQRICQHQSHEYALRDESLLSDLDSDIEDVFVAVRRIYGIEGSSGLDQPFLWQVIVGAGLGSILKSYVAYYTKWRTHLPLQKDAPHLRPVCRSGRIVAISQVGGLHHGYERRAA